eukprot:13178376-Alexandrium_andersonii.AAC.1
MGTSTRATSGRAHSPKRSTRTSEGRKIATGARAATAQLIDKRHYGKKHRGDDVKGQHAAKREEGLAPTPHGES